MLKGNFHVLEKLRSNIGVNKFLADGLWNPCKQLVETEVYKNIQKKIKNEIEEKRLKRA